MATVRFSEQLKDDILHNAKNLFAEQLKQAQQSYPDIADKVYDKFFTADVVGKMNALPNGFLEEKESIDFSGFVGIPTDVDANMYKVSGFPLQFTSARKWPAKWPDIMTGAEIDWRSLRLKWEDERWDDLKQSIYDYNKRINEVIHKKTAFVEGVKEVINTYATLAPALKAWPALWDLVPEDAKERHKKVVERKKKDASEINTDLSNLTAQVTFSKLTK